MAMFTVGVGIVGAEEVTVTTGLVVVAAKLSVATAVIV